MQNPQSLPTRSLCLQSDDPDAIGAVQPERNRRYEQISRGSFQGSVIEETVGYAGILRERWSCGMRVRCDRPSGYTAFAVPAIPGSDANWCGAALAPGVVLRINEPWELSTSGSFEFVAFAVDHRSLEAVAAQLAGGERPKAPDGNRARYGLDAASLADRMLRLLHILRLAKGHPAALAVAEEDLLHLAAGLDRSEGWAPVAISPASQRRRVVRRIEEYLDAERGNVPSIPTLCSVAGVSERTLEYAFREHLGMTPVRYLRILRLNQVHRDLKDAEPGCARVTEIALRSGFFDLGRFAGEYRSLFGELPSETLGRVAPRRFEKGDAR